MKHFKNSCWFIVTGAWKMLCMIHTMHGLSQQRPTPAQAMHEKPEQGKPLLVTMAAHQPGEGKGKGKDGGWRSWGWNTWDYIWLIYGLYMDNRWIISGYVWYTLWLCQNNFGKWLEIVDFCPLEMVMFHSYVMLNYQRVCCSLEHWQDWCIKQDTIIWDEPCFLMYWFWGCWEHNVQDIIS